MLISQAVEAQRENTGCQEHVCFMQGYVCAWSYQVRVNLAFESPHRKVIIMVTMEITNAVSYTFCM